MLLFTPPRLVDDTVDVGSGLRRSIWLASILIGVSGHAAPTHHRLLSLSSMGKLRSLYIGGHFDTTPMNLTFGTMGPLVSPRARYFVKSKDPAKK